MNLAALPAGAPPGLGAAADDGRYEQAARAMENADVLLAVGTRGVCQSDMSRTGYPRVTKVVNINSDPADVVHYNHAIPLLGDARLTPAMGAKEAPRESWTIPSSRPPTSPCKAGT